MLTFDLSRGLEKHRPSSNYIAANIGGLLGLFMGFSVFSIIEVFYFLSIRPYCSYLRDADKRRLAFQKISNRFKHLRVRPSLNLNSDTNLKVHDLVFPHLN